MRDDRRLSYGDAYQPYPLNVFVAGLGPRSLTPAGTTMTSIERGSTWPRGALKTGILHKNSGTVTIVDAPLGALLRSLAARMNRRSALDGSQLEAVFVDQASRVCAGFWP
jgi:hypothetical protein